MIRIDLSATASGKKKNDSLETHVKVRPLIRLVFDLNLHPLLHSLVPL